MKSKEKNIELLIDELHQEIIGLRFELVTLRRNKSEKQDQEQADAEIKEKTNMLTDLEKYFREIVKSESIMNRYEKGIGKKSGSGAIIKNLPDTKSNLGAIVQQVPHVSNDKP